MPALHKLIAYVGCRTTKERNAQGKGLAVFRVTATGCWEHLQLVEGIANPSYLCLHPTQPRLYAVHGDFSEVSTFGIRPNGLLDLLSVDTTEGRNPVHLAISASNRWLLIANYASGSVVTRSLETCGKVGPVASMLQLVGEPGPHPQQGSSHPHQICIGPFGGSIYVPDKGLDKVFTLELDDANGALSMKSSTDFPAGSGPRHMVIEASSLRAYVVGELSRTVHFGCLEQATGRLRIDGVRSTVPPSVATGSAAGIVLDELRSRLYVSNRGHSSVVSFQVDRKSGALNNAHWSTTDKTPRFITSLAKSLVVAHEDGHSIWRIDYQTLKLECVAETGSPVCVVFRQLA